MKKEEFIKRAVTIHGSKYSYELLPDVFSTKIKVPILCEQHGVFYKNTDNHMRGQGCPECAHINKSITTRKSLFDFQKELYTKFPDIIVDFEGYVDSSSKVRVYCDTHGWVERVFKDVLRSKYKCSLCSINLRGITRRKGLDEFLEKARKAHGDLYDYSLVDFEKFGTPVKIICREHGIFEQTPTVHIKGFGCLKCANTAVGNLKRKPIEDLPLELFNDPNVIADLSSYTKSSSPMKFTCKIHGEFTRIPSSRLIGESVCPKCNYIKIGEDRKTSQDDFISKAKTKFPYYDYSESVYDGAHKYIIVTCDKGHRFKQRAGNLLNGYGCPDCSSTGFSYSKVGYLYLISLNDTFVKFGISNKPESRLKALKRNSIYDHYLIQQFEFKDGSRAKELEDIIKNLDIPIGVVDKYDLTSGYTETFSVVYLDLVLSEIHKFISQLK